jgi:hypothetical protein
MHESIGRKFSLILGIITLGVCLVSVVSEGQEQEEAVAARARTSLENDFRILSQNEVSSLGLSNGVFVRGGPGNGIYEVPAPTVSLVPNSNSSNKSTVRVLVDFGGPACAWIAGKDKSAPRTSCFPVRQYSISIGGVSRTVTVPRHVKSGHPVSAQQLSINCGNCPGVENGMQVEVTSKFEIQRSEHSYTSSSKAFWILR